MNPGNILAPQPLFSALPWRQTLAGTASCQPGGDDRHLHGLLWCCGPVPIPRPSATSQSQFPGGDRKGKNIPLLPGYRPLARTGLAFPGSAKFPCPTSAFYLLFPFLSKALKLMLLKWCPCTLYTVPTPQAHRWDG